VGERARSRLGVGERALGDRNRRRSVAAPLRSRL
jgi:hypothetical protein